MKTMHKMKKALLVDWNLIKRSLNDVYWMRKWGSRRRDKGLWFWTLLRVLGSDRSDRALWIQVVADCRNRCGPQSRQRNDAFQGARGWKELSRHRWPRWKLWTTPVHSAHLEVFLNQPTSILLAAKALLVRRIEKEQTRMRLYEQMFVSEHKNLHTTLHSPWNGSNLEQADNAFCAGFQSIWTKVSSNNSCWKFI